MTATNKHTAELVKLASDIPTSIEALEAEITQVAASMDVLKRAGLIYATEHWRKGAKGADKGKEKYFYLLYPHKNGEPRRRDYVGCDAVKIEEARAGIERASQYDRLATQYAAMENRIHRVAQALHEAQRYLNRN
jgi:hypothetical protein